jgi:acetyl-CoA carboxylase biotin carboxyl carrier protein
MIPADRHGMEQGTTSVSSSRDAIRRVVEAFERSDWSEIDVRSGSLRVHLSVSAATSSPATTPGPPPAAATAPGGSAGEAGTRTDGQTNAQPGPSATASAHPPPTGAHVVVSPSPGIFWRSPEPGRPPFVDIGHTVEASATVCIVEVMKLMNHVKARVGGEVVAVYCENGVAVQKDQALFAIAPSESSP